MEESELKLEHAFKSAALNHDIRSILAVKPCERVEWSKEAMILVNRIDEIIQQTPDKYVPAEWQVIAAGLRVLVSQVVCLAIAHGAKGNLIAERARNDVLVSELCSLLSLDAMKTLEGTDSILHLLLQMEQQDFGRLCEFLLSIPLPTLYWHSKETILPFKNVTEKIKTVPNSLLRLIVFIDHIPIASPQLLKPGILYQLVFRVRGLGWPDNASCLRLNLLTTCPQNAFSVSEFVLAPPHCIKNDEYCGELVGQIVFNFEQSNLLDDLIFTISGAFETLDGGFKEIPIIGHNVLRLKVVNENKHPLMTGNRQMDRHIEELVTKLCTDCPKIHEELPDLLKMLEALTRLLTIYAQRAIYKGESNVPESEFQATVLRDLGLLLGQDVQEHPSQAGGITDIKYRGVIVELKVETKNGDRKYISNKYTAQTVQYAGVEARQVSILLVLDLTSKDKPPCDIRNDIILTDVETHGGSDEVKEFPSKAFIFVINGNLKSPSVYSR